MLEGFQNIRKLNKSKASKLAINKGSSPLGTDKSSNSSRSNIDFTCDNKQNIPKKSKICNLNNKSQDYKVQDRKFLEEILNVKESATKNKIPLFENIESNINFKVLSQNIIKTKNPKPKVNNFKNDNNDDQHLEKKNNFDQNCHYINTGENEEEVNVCNDILDSQPDDKEDEELIIHNNNETDDDDCKAIIIKTNIEDVITYI